MNTEQIKKCLTGIQEAESVLSEIGDDDIYSKLMDIEEEITRKYDNKNNQ